MSEQLNETMNHNKQTHQFTDLIDLPAGVDLDRKNFDVGEYLKQLDGFEISEQEKTELLIILHDIMKRFVELGWGIDSVSMLERVEPTKKTEK